MQFLEASIPDFDKKYVVFLFIFLFFFFLGLGRYCEVNMVTDNRLEDTKRRGVGNVIRESIVVH